MTGLASVAWAEEAEDCKELGGEERNGEERSMALMMVEEEEAQNRASSEQETGRKQTMVVSQLMDMRKATERRRAHDCHNQSASLAAPGMGWALSAEEDSCMMSPA